MKLFKNNKKILYILIISVFVVGVICFKYAENNKENDIEIMSFTEEVNENNNTNENKTSEKNQEENTEQEIYVHIIGEVKNEGIVVIKKGERVIDAIEKAGGVTEQADLNKINLAYKLSDGQKIKIPNINEKETSQNDNLINGFTESKNELHNKVNINTASQTELETLTGIGPSLASKIIAYRKKNGNFKKIEEIQNVSGIGTEKYDGIKEEIEV